MNHNHHIKHMDVIRFRSGSSALMKVRGFDTLCGYVTYHGMHLYGEKISVSGDQCRLASKDDLRVWKEFRGQRRAHTLNINIDEDLSWAS